MKRNTDTILCKDKQDAKAVIDAIGSEHIENWDYLDGGEIKLYLNCRMKDIKEKGE